MASRISTGVARLVCRSVGVERLIEENGEVGV